MIVRGQGLWKPTSWLALMGLLAGCGHALGPEPMVTTTLVGRLHVGDRPIGRGWVQFLPVEGTLGTLRSAPLAPDGSFRMEKAPVGRVAVGFAGPMPDYVPNAEIYPFLLYANRAFPARRTIAAGSPSSVDIDLEPERIVYDKIRANAR